MAHTGPDFRRYIKSITVTSVGSGYSSSDPPIIFIGAPDATTGGIIQAVATVNISSNTVDSITINEPGDGYLTTPEVYLRGTLGAVTNTSVIDTTRPVGTFTNVPMDTSSKIGSGAEFTIVTNSSGGVDSITVTEKGDVSFMEGETITVNSNRIGGTGDEQPITMTVSKISGNGYGAEFSPVIDVINRPPQFFHNNQSFIIPYEIPEFIRTDYPQFASFVEHYYEFLDADKETIEGLGGNLASPSYVLEELIVNFGVNPYHDDFLEVLLQQYAVDFPLDKEIDTRLLIKKIRDFYEAKGSSKGVETFFRAVYDEEVEVFRPSEYVLRPSDGVYNKEVTIKVYNNSDYTGTTNTIDLAGTKVNIYYYTSVGSITQRKSFNTSVLRVKQIAYTAPTAIELTIDLPSDTEIPGFGVEGALSAVIGGEIATVDTISAADVLRASGTYDINSGFTTDGNGTGAEFTITVDGSGAASITVDTAGNNYAPDETITIPDSLLGSGGAADLTFDVATITNGKIFSVTIDDAGQGYSANPLVTVVPHASDTITTTAVVATRVTSGSITSTVFVNDVQGSGYNNVPTLVLNTDPYRSYIALESDTLDVIGNKIAFLTRVLNTVELKTNTGQPDGGFNVGDTFIVSETGDILGVYAIDYFDEDYTLTGIDNNAYVRIKTLDSSNYPSVVEIIATGTGFQRAEFDFILRSGTLETATITCMTGFAHTFPGQFKDSRGFLSDVNKLHDNQVYQDFAYQIRSSLPKTTWGDALSRTAHPAGMVAFSDLQIHQTVNFGINYNILPDTFVYRLFNDVEEILVQDTPVLFVVKNISENPTVNDDEGILEPGLVKTENPEVADDINSLDVELNKTEDPTINDAPTLTVEKPTIADSVTFSEVVDILKFLFRTPTETIDFSETVTRIVQLNKSETPNVNDVQAFDITTTASDSSDASDAIDKLDIGNSTSDTTSATEAEVFLFSSTRTDSPTTSDTGQVIMQNYAGDYFAEDYVGEARSF